MSISSVTLGRRSSTLLVEDRRVKSILNEMTKCQGGFVEGRRDEALDRIANEHLPDGEGFGGR